MEIPTTRNIGRPVFRKEDSLPGKLERFFNKNPDEELTIDDIVIKFNVSRNTAWVAVSRDERLTSEGGLVRRKLPA